MTPAFDWSCPARMVFGPGRVRELGAMVAPWGQRCLLFTGTDPSRAEAARSSLCEANLSVELVPVAGEPTFDGVRAALGRAFAQGTELVVAVGGGSVIDAAKAVAMLLANGGDPMDYAEVIGRGMPITQPSIPWAAVPTTAGAGAEATRNAVLVDPASASKVSLRNPLMVAPLVVIDPVLAVSLPPAVTAATALDALSQLIEPYVSVRANPMTDALARAGIPLIVRSLARACEQPDDLAARGDLALAAWWSGLALANAGLGAVHGFAAAIGGRIAAPHGLVCARFLAPVGAANIAALRRDGDPDGKLARYRDLAALLCGNPAAGEDEGVRWIEEFVRTLPLPALPELGHPEAIVEAALRSSSMKGNPVALGRDQLLDILARTAGR